MFPVSPCPWVRAPSEAFVEWISADVGNGLEVPPPRVGVEASVSLGPMREFRDGHRGRHSPQHAWEPPGNIGDGVQVRVK